MLGLEALGQRGRRGRREPFSRVTKQRRPNGDENRKSNSVQNACIAMGRLKVISAGARIRCESAFASELEQT